MAPDGHPEPEEKCCKICPASSFLTEITGKKRIPAYKTTKVPLIEARLYFEPSGLMCSCIPTIMGYVNLKQA